MLKKGHLDISGILSENSYDKLRRNSAQRKFEKAHVIFYSVVSYFDSTL